MPADRETPTEAGESLLERLHRLRIKIDSLPESQRPHLLGLAEAIACQHRRLQSGISRDHDAE